MSYSLCCMVIITFYRFRDLTSYLGLFQSFHIECLTQRQHQTGGKGACERTVVQSLVKQSVFFTALQLPSVSKHFRFALKRGMNAGLGR